MKRIALYTFILFGSLASNMSAEEEIFSIEDEKEFHFENDAAISDEGRLIQTSKTSQEPLKLVERTEAILKNSKKASHALLDAPIISEKKATVEQVSRAPFSQELEKIKVASEPLDSIAIQIDKEMVESEPLAKESPHVVKNEEAEPIEISFKQVFKGAPVIYSLLIMLSIAAFGIWIYNLLLIRGTELFPKNVVQDLRAKLMSNQFTEALHLCQKEDHFLCKMVGAGILSRKQGLGIMTEMMKAEGKRSTIGFWQRLNLLNDIALVAPMLGLLGTVMGMFYAFYDLHRSTETLSILFDGLGVSVGTTIAGLIVAILSMTLHSIGKYRLVKALSSLENEAQTMASYIETKGPSYIET